MESEEAAAEEEAEHDEIMEEASTIHKVNAFLKRKRVELHISGMGLAIVKNVPRGRYLSVLLIQSLCMTGSPSRSLPHSFPSHRQGESRKSAASAQARKKWYCHSLI